MSDPRELITRFARELAFFLKSNPNISLESADHATPEMDFNLGSVRNNVEIHSRSGDKIFITALTGVAYIRTRLSGAKYKLRIGSISLPFEKLFLTNTAQAGKTLSLIVGYGAFVDFPIPKERLKTNILDISDQNVDSGAISDFLSISNSFGYVKEFLILSPSTDFSVIVKVDDKEILNKTYTQYTAITQVIKDISAFEERDSDGNPLSKYIVSLIGISFKESITIQVKNNSGSSVIFEKCFCKYEMS